MEGRCLWACHLLWVCHVLWVCASGLCPVQGLNRLDLEDLLVDIADYIEADLGRNQEFWKVQCAARACVCACVCVRACVI